MSERNITKAGHVKLEDGVKQECASPTSPAWTSRVNDRSPSPSASRTLSPTMRSPSPPTRTVSPTLRCGTKLRSPSPTRSVSPTIDPEWPPPMPASLPIKEKTEKKVKKEKKKKKKEKTDKKEFVEEKTEPIEKKESDETSQVKAFVVEKKLKVEKENVKEEGVNETDIYGMDIEQDGGVHDGGSATSSRAVPTTLSAATSDVYASTRHPKLIPTTEFEERIRAQRDRRNARDKARKQRRAAERRQPENG